VELKKVLIPVDNEKDLKDVHDEIKNNIEVILVTHLDDVIEHALEKKPLPIEWDENEFLRNRKNNVSEAQESIVKH
jgi:ATP-dependent Lon protease